MRTFDVMRVLAPCEPIWDIIIRRPVVVTLQRFGFRSALAPSMGFDHRLLFPFLMKRLKNDPMGVMRPNAVDDELIAQILERVIPERLCPETKLMTFFRMVP